MLHSETITFKAHECPIPVEFIKDSTVINVGVNDVTNNFFMPYDIIAGIRLDDLHMI